MSTEGRKDNKKHPGIGSGYVIKVLKIWIKFWNVVAVCGVDDDKKCDTKFNPATIVGGQNHQSHQGSIMMSIGFYPLLEMIDFAHILSFVVLITPVFQTQFLVTYTKETRNLSSHLPIQINYSFIFNIIGIHENFK